MTTSELGQVVRADHDYIDLLVNVKDEDTDHDDDNGDDDDTDLDEMNNSSKVPVEIKEEIIDDDDEEEIGMHTYFKLIA